VLLIGIALLASGCATPIGVSYVDRRVAYESLTTNVLSTERMSSFSARELFNFNLYQEFADNPQKALADLHSGLAPKGNEDRLFALAELSFLHAENSGERTYYLASAVYAYAFLFPEDNTPQPDPLDPRRRLAADIYNLGLVRGLDSPDGEEVLLKEGKYELPFGELDLTLEASNFSVGRLPTEALCFGGRVRHSRPAQLLSAGGNRRAAGGGSGTIGVGDRYRSQSYITAHQSAGDRLCPHRSAAKGSCRREASRSS